MVKSASGPRDCYTFAALLLAKKFRLAFVGRAEQFLIEEKKNVCWDVNLKVLSNEN
jgi:hypothetical protein